MARYPMSCNDFGPVLIQTTFVVFDGHKHRSVDSLLTVV